MALSKASAEEIEKCIRVLRPALLLAPRKYLDDLRQRLADEGTASAVRRRDSAALFDWIVRLLARQGISNQAAEAFLARKGSPTLEQIAGLMSSEARCPRLQSYWHFEDCGYRRSTGTCNTPHHLVGCPVAAIPARKGTLAEAAVALWLFIRDICDSDLIGWIDRRLAAADAGGGAGRAAAMRSAILTPLTDIVGTGSKVWSMILAELLLGADPGRERWTMTGASFIAVDSLVHAYLRRTGILRRLGAEHQYGPACYAPGGCADVIAALAGRIDAREFNPTFPAVFPRWLQFAVWWFCAADGWATCNGDKIDDARGCKQQFCPVFEDCARLPMPRGSARATNDQ